MENGVWMWDVDFCMDGGRGSEEDKDMIERGREKEEC
jgi:hypothetical protein